MLCTPPEIVHSECALTAYANDFLSLAAPHDAPWPRVITDDAIGTLSYLSRVLVRTARQTSENGGAMVPFVVAQLDCFLQSERVQTPLSKGEESVVAAEKSSRNASLPA